jgi:signal transduction histidine kinase/GAF domain-containing protein/ActR/RegA family two-component response regulator
MIVAAIPHDEEERLSALHSLGLVGSVPEDSYDGLVACAAQLCACPIALISLADRDREWFKSALGTALTGLPRDQSICGHALAQSSLFEVHDLAADPRFTDHPLVVGEPFVRFYAGEPLRLDGRTLGTLSVCDTVPRTLTEPQRAAMRQLAGAANELLRSRQRLRALDAERSRLLDFARSSGDWMWELDADLRHTWIAGAFESVTGLRAADVLGRRPTNAPLLDAVGEPLRDGQRLHDVLRTGRTFSRVTAPLDTPKGRLAVSFSAVPVLAPDGAFAGWRGTARDVTQRLRAAASARAQEATLHRLQAAEEAHRGKSEFLSRVSHELRTPLNGILGFMDVMALDREHALAPEQRRRLEGAQRASRHLLRLVDDVLDLTRIERDDFHLELSGIDLQRTGAEAVALVAPLAQAHAVRLPAHLPEPAWVIADRRALEQALLNLLSNAIKYNRPGGAVGLEVRVHAERVRLTVIDEGAGLTDGQLRQLFQPFNRLGAERTRTEGTGLGLVIARKLVRAMGGEVHVTSQLGVGSRFTVELGAAQPHHADHAGPCTIDSMPMPLADGAPRRVLYIEDEPLNVVLMEEVFRGQQGWTLHVERDGARGMAAARRSSPHLLLIDMNLPDMTGIEVVRTLRADPATALLRCIALSADAMPDQIGAARAAGVDDYWTKPIDVRRMIKALARALDGA